MIPGVLCRRLFLRFPTPKVTFNIILVFATRLVHSLCLHFDPFLVIALTLSLFSML
jgi:hypothetical protein